MSSGVPSADDRPAPEAALGAEVDDPVGRLDDVEVVLDDQHGVAGVDQARQHGEQPADVLEVQAGRGLVEDVDGVAGRALGQLGGQLHPLGLAAREGGGGLAEPDVAEADVDDRLHVPGDDGLVGEEGQGLLAAHLEDVGDVLALEGDVEGVAVVAGALAHLARHVDVGQEVHLDLDRAVAGARLAPAAGHVEAEPAGQVAADLRLLGLGEQLADVVEHAGVGGRVRPRRAPDRRLVDVDDLVEQLDALDPLVEARAASSTCRSSASATGAGCR